MTPLDVQAVLDTLALPRSGARLVHVRREPARTAVTADLPGWLDPALAAACRASGIESLWGHQREAADLVHAGRHVVVATGTASGKSLAYTLPVLSDLMSGARGVSGRDATALYLSPTKALTGDQLERVQSLAGAASGVRCASYDGDTPTDERRWIRRNAAYVLTNPDMLHHAILPGHGQWSGFLRALRYVVVDECHVYRGVFGSHLAAVMRRLRRLAARYGAEPTFVFASATAADPVAQAEALCGLPVLAVTRDDSPRGPATYALLEPEAPLDAGVGEHASSGVAGEGASDRAVSSASTDSTRERALDDVGLVGVAAAGRAVGAVGRAVPADSGAGTGRTTDGAACPHDGPDAADGDTPDGEQARPASTLTVSARLLADFVGRGVQTVAFARSRLGVEVVATRARRLVASGSSASSAERAVAAYRGGYLPEERRALETELRSGGLMGLAATSALELGIDISDLDAVILAGWPGTRASFWQRAGRAGRSGGDSLAVLVASDDPLDHYLVHHPEAIFEAPVEGGVLDPANPFVLAPHLAAAAAELPLTEADADLFGPSMVALADVLVQRGALRRRPSGWFWTRPERPSDLVSLRGIGDTVRIVEAATGRVLGTVDAARADTSVHTGAVYLHQQRPYVVTELDLDDGAAMVVAGDPGWSTQARTVSAFDILGVDDHHDLGEVTLNVGSVAVRTRVTSFVRRLPTGEILGEHALDLPERLLRTKAVWWTMTPEVLAEADVVDVPGAAHAAEHASIALLPLLATAERWDIGGVSTQLHPDTGLPTVMVYDGLPGGAGIAQRGFARWRDWLSRTRQLIATCACASGCPACVQSPKCGNGNEPLDKAAAVRLLDVVLAAAPASPAAGEQLWDRAVSTAPGPEPAARASVPGPAPTGRVPITARPTRRPPTDEPPSGQGSPDGARVAEAPAADAPDGGGPARAVARAGPRPKRATAVGTATAAPTSAS